MEPGRKIEFHAWLPWTFSGSFLRESAMRSPVPLPSIVSATVPLLPQPHAVAVAVGVRALVVVAGGGRVADLAHDDHAGGAAVDAQRAPGAHVVVDHEDHVVARVEAGLVDAEGLVHRVGGDHVDALPRADVDA